jgi:Beta-xylosidase
MKKERTVLLFVLGLVLSSCGESPVLSSSIVSSSSQTLTSSFYQNSLLLTAADGTTSPLLGADPDVIEGKDGYYYLYTSQQYVVVGNRGKMLDRSPIYRSKDLVNWSYCSSVFLDQEVDLGSFAYSDVGIWAPSIHYFFDTYYCYYSLGYAGENVEHCGIGLATSSTPYGPWTHHGKLFDSIDCGYPVSIDPFAYQTDDGTIYLFWGSFFAINAVELSLDGIEVKDLANIKTNLITVIGGTPSSSESYEATFIIKKDNRYIFMGSQNPFDGGLSSKYEVRSGSSASLFGPYRDSSGNDIYGHGDLLIRGDPSEGGLRGPGHHALIQDKKGAYWMFYHAYDATVNGGNERVICLDKILFDEHGVPTVEGGVPSQTSKEGPAVLL